MIAEDYFLIAPDWQYELSISRKWNTAIQTSLVLGEKRSKLIDYPIKKHRFTIVPFDANENNYIKRKLYRARDKKFGVPIWCDRCSTTMQVDSGTGLTFTVNDNTNRMFEVGGLVILIEDQDNYEVKEIDTIGSNQFTVVDSFTGTWASGTDVYPIIQGRLSSQHKLDQYTTRGHSSIEMVVEEDYDADITRTVYSGSTFSDYLSYPVFNLEPEWSTSPEQSVEVFPEVTRFLMKSIDYSYAAEGVISLKHIHRLYSRADVYEVVKFFDEQCGRWGDFWFPSWQDDVVLTSTFLNTDTVLSIEDIEWNDYWRHNKSSGRYLYVLLPNGTEIIRKIVSAPSSTSLQVDSAMGTTITSLQKIISCFLYMGRFKMDEITVSWFNESIARIELNYTATNDNEDIIVTTTTT